MDIGDLSPVSAPMPWQAEVWSRLLQQLGADTLPHALLLAGPRGSGKARLALALSRMLLCKSPLDGHNCGDCHPCHLSRSGGHGDLRWLQPLEKSRMIRIDQVREAVQFAAKTASFGSRKVLVFNPADALNLAASNALLKCLEEPAAGTFLLLVCHRLHSLPATIRSRCQLVRLPLPSRAQSDSWLQHITADAALSNKLLDSVDNSPLLAEQLYLQGNAEQRLATQQALTTLRKGEISAAEMIPLFADAPLELILEQLRLSLQRWLAAASREELASACCHNGFALLDELQRLQGALDGGSNPNRQLLLESLLYRVQRELGGAL